MEFPDWVQVKEKNTILTLTIIHLSVPITIPSAFRERLHTQELLYLGNVP